METNGLKDLFFTAMFMVAQDLRIIHLSDSLLQNHNRRDDPHNLLHYLLHSH